jgi:mannan endo-1,4-beta-mannosidase
MYDRLTEHHGLHNLIWEFTSSAADANHLEWYPGDEVVDMVGLDVYTDPAASMNGQWHDVLAHYNGRKMIALSETGTLSNPAALDTWGIDWSYFAPWTWDFIRDQYITQRGYTEAQLQSLLQDLLNDGDIIALGELPLLPWSNAAPIAGDYNRDGAVDAADYVVWRNRLGQSGSGLTADGDFSGQVDGGDYNIWRTNFGQTAGSSSLTDTPDSPANVPEPASVVLLAEIVLVSLLRGDYSRRRTTV